MNFCISKLGLLWFGCWLLVSVSPVQGFQVVIDAGHGGHDPGAASGNVYEKHLALDVARRLERYLRKRGVRTKMSRPDNNFISLDGRVAIANRLSDAVFVSIHFNSAENRDAQGIETFFFTPQSELLAHLVHENMIHKTGLTNRGVKLRGFRVIKRTRVPSILVEGGFLSNRSERKVCTSRRHRQRLAEAIGFALIRYRSVR